MGYVQKPLDYRPFHEFHFHVVLLIPCSAIAKTVIVRSLIFYIFTHVENQPLKQRLTQKLCIIFLNVQNMFLNRIIFCLKKIHIFELYLLKII